MKKILCAALGFGILISNAALISNMPVSASFSDTGGTPSSEAVTFLQEQGTIQGYQDGTYRPDQEITRAEFLKIALKSSDLLEENCTNPSKAFPDVLAADWFYSVVCTAVNKNIVQGYPDGTFRPNALINFVEASKIVAEIEKLDLPEAAGTEWFSAYKEALQDERVIPESIASDNQELTRGEMAQIMWGLETGMEVEEEAAVRPSELESCTELNKQLEKFWKRNQYGYGGFLQKGLEGFGDDVMAPVPAQEGDRGDSGGGGGLDYSTTNLQELGVDEADIVKNDGSHIFVLRGNTVRIIAAVPPENMKEVARISIEEEGFTPQELYLDDDILTVIGYSYDVSLEGDMIPGKFEEDSSEPSGSAEDSILIEEKIATYPAEFGRNFVKIVSFDISDRVNPKRIRNVSLEGGYVSTRKIDDVVYVVVNKNSWWWPIMPLLEDGSSDSGAVGEDTLPQFYDSANPDQKLVAPCSDIMYFPNFAEPNYLTVAAINIKDTSEEVGRTVLLGSGGTVYASPDNIYVTRPDYREISFREGTDLIWRPAEMTEIYKFGLNGNRVPFVAKGEVEGNVWSQFAMSEHDDHFRIATQKGWNWGNSETSSSVYVLDGDMSLTGKIEGIAPGETIRAVRFMGDKGYLVTFRNVDPLFVIDMTPGNPKILGKLKIPGWSDYLHPYDENHLIGLGTEVRPEAEGKDMLLQEDILGLKLALFDISDLSNPREMHKEVIGVRGTSSEAAYNHKAFLFDKGKGILAFPVMIMAEKEPEFQCSNYTYENCPSSCYRTEEVEAMECTGDDCSELVTERKCIQPPWESNTKVVFSGAQVYDVDLENGFTLRGQATNFDEKWFEKEQEWFAGDWDRTIQRMIYIGDYFYSIAPNIIQALNWDDLSEVKEIELDPLSAKQCEEIWNEFDCGAHPSCEPVWQSSQECRLDASGNKVCDDGQQYFARCERK